MTVFITIAEILGYALLVPCAIVWLVSAVDAQYRQSRCAHDQGIRETRACDAICLHCNKNLGFIGSQQNQQRVREHTNRPTGRK